MQVCVEPRPSALSTTLPAFAAEPVRRLPDFDRYLLQRPRSAANPPHAAAAVDRRDRWADGHPTVI